MASIFVRSLIYNVLFYLLLSFWVIVGIPTYADAARGDPAYREIVGTQQHLVDGRRVQHQG